MYSYTTELAEGESIPTLSTLPNIVVVVDELADMMMIVGKKVECHHRPTIPASLDRS
jgi:S-DNA-T family DNA segregation ATPase FtsK/SpoIIIE